MKYPVKFFISLIILALLLSSAFANSLWSEKSESYYVSPKAKNIGDIITIYISETTSAAQESGTKAEKESKIKGNIFDTWEQVAYAIAGDETKRRRQELEISGGDEYSGTGRTSRKSSVNAVMTAVISDIMKNGNLMITGTHKVKVNDETETVVISGIIRPEDITQKNTIFSYQIAETNISVKGTGTVGNKQSPGILTRIFNWLF